MKLFRIVSLALACALPAVTWAQWVWVDKDGRKVFSDQAPPADIPAKSVIKQPGGARLSVAAAEPEAAASGAAKPAKPASAPRLSGKDKELEEKKKLADAAEAEKKKADDEKRAKVQADNCARAKQTKANFDSGTRIARTNAKGEREVLDDAARAAETKHLQDVIATDCK
ncbi:MAG: DUF4124 domain-containing protein [Burkholderiales bacterium]|nr:DUF4124 domain-containing protein [Burkholderiales bacterium]